MYLDFINSFYREEALKTISINYKNNISSADAFLILLKDLDYLTIDNLCKVVSKKLSIDDPKKIYEIMQSDNCEKSLKQLILDVAYELVHSNIRLGNKMKDKKSNSSSWISHSLYEGEVASVLASKLGLDLDTARKIGLLHDVGRKFDHSFMHTIKGYEYLKSLGLDSESICCLTHSFLPSLVDNKLRGNRCANCDQVVEGFYIDEKGNGVFKKDSKLDDMTIFLQNYNYNLYDIVLNISDLMATDKGVLSPYDRMLDIYTRKTPNKENSSFFKVSFINNMLRILYYITNDEKYNKTYNINDIKDIEKLLIKTSNTFMSMYNNIKENNKTL